ncbi:chemotaxis protein CheA [Psychromonas sp. psych-6C06]|uniref:chemotaxis protein CheW n=1 Tax=Psychromonas sp. psych-6C06 TaxID=2058089 RepID=UPI000C343AF2|nr:chemotaxis protein CheW [Psychromonas sp. psych-6C06]PKF62205.1 chemotaxis protein CheA [Psychromonas sp. psych-6C06]
MSIDMQQFNAVFFEEVSEHLTNMESLLLDIDVNEPNLEDLNAIFRAAHSIKGGAGIFGFEDMTQVTHILETLLDKLRKEELALTTEMIDAFLKAGDVLAEQKEVHQEGGEPVESSLIEAVCNQLQKLSSPPETSVEEVTSFTAEEEIADKQISFLVDNDENPENLLQELASLGALTQHSEVVAGFTKWLLVLSNCHSSNEELIDIISFIAEPDSILVTDLIETDDDDSFGFFDDDIEPQACFGLFEPEEHEATAALQDNALESNDDSYGLFCDDEAPVSDLIENSSVVQDTAVSNDQEVETEAYGFLDGREEKKESVKQVMTSPERKKRPAAKTATQVETSIRVNTEKVDQLINQVGELVITQAMLMQISNNLDPSEHDILLNRLTQLERNTRDLQESVMSIRMMPISFVFGRFPRVVRDLSNKLNKKIDLRMVGDETELDKGLVEQLADPLTHLIRNSIDHGIEMPEERIANGKPESGTITLSAFYEGGNVVINISDDGAGLNRDKILSKAIERGLQVDENISDNDVYQLIFSAGFSTADQVTDVSGRGVGMDVVKRNIHSMGGQVEIYSQAGEGSTISIRLPLTLAILDGMSISVAGQIYIIPLTFISESLQPQPQDIKKINGTGTVVKVRGDYIPMLALHELFNIQTDIKEASDGILVLLESNNKKIALLVDQLEGQQQVVLKSLETNFHAVPCISGATIMGDGSVALILDVAGLVSESD